METFANTCINMSMNMPTRTIVFTKTFQNMQLEFHPTTDKSQESTLLA